MASLYKYLIHLTFAIIVSIIFFVLREDLTTLDLFSYCFILFAYFVMVISPTYTKEHLNKTISDLPLYAFSSVYLVLEILLAFAIPYYNLTGKSYTIIQTVLTGFFLIILFITLNVNKITQEQVQNFKQGSVNSKNTRLILEKLLFKVQFDSSKEKIKDLIETVKISPILSSEETEAEIFEKLKSLSDLIETLPEESINQRTEEIKNLYLLRNNILKH
ncbi:MAG: hypothetical protein K6C94_00760 [Candidatus Gastranaerophilales bacterium]|nr:hypothetical protein [Candidatus Gastranaerophilales bacterium]